MTEPINSRPTPLTQFPVQETDPVEADPNFGDQLPPDPLLESGTFIDVGAVETKMPTNQESESAPSTAAETTTTADATPLSQRQRKKLPQEMVERPSWLPEDWRVEVRVRTSGATAGTTDRYFFSPSGHKLRSKKEVLHYLETGSKPRRKLKSNNGASASDKPSGSKQKKSKAHVKNFSGINFDFKNPPQSVDYVLTNQGEVWVPSIDNRMLPEKKAEWDSIFSRVTQLDSRKGSS